MERDGTWPWDLEIDTMFATSVEFRIRLVSLIDVAISGQVKVLLIFSNVEVFHNLGWDIQALNIDKVLLRVSWVIPRLTAQQTPRLNEPPTKITPPLQHAQP